MRHIEIGMAVGWILAAQPPCGSVGENVGGSNSDFEQLLVGENVGGLSPELVQLRVTTVTFSLLSRYA